MMSFRFRLSGLFTFLFAVFFFVSFAAFPGEGFAAGAGQSASAAGGSITVSAAISLKNAFEQMAGAFEAEKQNRGAKIFLNFASSGDLASQIVAGAPVDVFASAAEKQMDELEKKGLVMPGTRKDFAGNTLVLIVPGAGASAVKGWSSLGRADVGRIAMGNPA
nr:molybdate ABC transporter substrate-binding protein [Nitrospiraceae bacterium]